MLTNILGNQNESRGESSMILAGFLAELRFTYYFKETNN